MGRFDERREMIAKTLEGQGHVLRRDEDGKIDWLAMCDDENFHNGPICDKCYMSWCEHCESTWTFKCE